MDLPNVPKDLADNLRGGYAGYFYVSPMYPIWSFVSLKYYGGNVRMLPNTGNIGFGRNTTVTFFTGGSVTSGGSCTVIINGRPAC
ncbi:MAG TPA: hypothetical protein VFM02_01590 [Candidatus Paceibacterota bacterium]|nr:hypothetical protein [Candidatus Paceibacterota bacterium]